MAKRENYTSWEEMFMGVASFASQRSKDPVRQVGCVIVNDKNHIVGVGFNGLPPGISDDEPGVWAKDPDDPLFNKKYLVVHAEMNAIANSNGSVAGCTAYVTHFPCNCCTKELAINGIKEVVYANDWWKVDKMEIKTMCMRHFNSAGIKVRPYDGNGHFVINVYE
jgi:dCMP deaminase